MRAHDIIILALAVITICQVGFLVWLFVFTQELQNIVDQNARRIIDKIEEK